jgi:quinol monooxygenase YgiN
MIVVVGTFRLPAAKLAEAREALARVIKATRLEPGCIDYAYAVDVLEPGLVRVSETWENRKALAAHFEAAHMVEWRWEREALGMSERYMRAYEVSTSETL